MGARNRDRMIPHPLRLGDVLRLEGALLATCSAETCHHSRVLPLIRLLEKYGRDQLVKDLEPRLVCSRCAHQGAAISIKVF